MSRSKKVLIVLGIWLGVGLVVAIALIPSAQAHDEEGAVAVCNWEDFEQYGHDGYNARWIACNHTLHTSPNGEYHSQWRNGAGTPGHTITFYRRQAREFRAWCGID